MGAVVTGGVKKNGRFAGDGIFVALAGMVLTSWVNTQILAHRFGYQAALGDAVATFKSFKIYQPFQWWSWHYQFSIMEGRVQEILTQGVWVILIGCCVSVAAAVYVWYRRSLKVATVEGLHGSARWAEFADVKNMKLITEDEKSNGIYLGIYEFKGKQYFLRYDGDAHTLVFAPTRSGKGVGLVLPTLLSNRNSVVVHDLKKENFMLTSGYRHQAGQLVICFDVTATVARSIDGKTEFRSSCCWNVLEEIRAFSEYDVMDAQNIAAAIADPDGEGMDDHWVSTSYELLTGLILHMLYGESDKTLAGCSTYLSDPSFADSEQMFNRMMNLEHDPMGIMGWVDSMGNPTKTHPQVAMAARSMLNKEEKERGSVLSTAKTKLALYTEPIVARNTRSSDFSVRDLMNHDKPVSLYIVVPPSDKERLRPLTRLLISFMLRRLTEGMAFEEGKSVRGYKHRLLAVIDELPALKKLETLEEGLGFIAGYGINAFLFVQDIIQLRKAYDQNQTIIAGCHNRVAYAPNTTETAEEISKMCGETTVAFEEVSYSGSRISSMLNQMNVNTQRIGRPLMDVGEVLSMRSDDSLVFVAGQPTIQAKKIKYYNVPIFQQRAEIVHPERIGYQYIDEDGNARLNWMMVSIERTSTPGQFNLFINVYDTYPEVEVVVKQSNVGGDQVHEFICNMTAAARGGYFSTLEVDVSNYILLVADTRFSHDDEFEVHFRIKNSEPLKDLTENGFYRVISMRQRLLMKDLRSAAEKESREVYFEEVWPGRSYIGTVERSDESFIVLKREMSNLMIYNIHRTGRIDKVVSVGRKIRIKYIGNQGKVSI